MGVLRAAFVGHPALVRTSYPAFSEQMDLANAGFGTLAGRWGDSIPGVGKCQSDPPPTVGIPGRERSVGSGGLANCGPGYQSTLV
jgi:hypothetical protein